MSSNYTREDFNDEMNDLELGLKKEQECLEFYSRSVEQVADPRVKSLYRWFVDATQARIAALETIRVAATDSQAWTTDMDEHIRAVDENVGRPPAFGGDVSGKPGRAEIVTLRQAIELEKETASIYFTAIRRSRDKNVREFWRYLAPAEGAHKDLLESYFDGLMQLVMKKKARKEY